MKHMPHFISDYGNGLFPDMEQIVLSRRNKSFHIRKQSVPTGCNKVFSTVN